MITITFLGTSGMVPTKERNVQGIFLKFDTEGILIDCGEGTQRQMNIAGINRNDVTKILISHWHGDHVSGLIGLIQTMGNALAGNPEQKTIEIYGPRGTEERMFHLMNSCIFDNKLDIKLIELEPTHLERFLDTDKYAIECVPLEHSVPCLGYRFIEKERRRIDLAKAKRLSLEEGPVMGELSRGKVVNWKGREIRPEEVTVTVPQKSAAFILDTQQCQMCYDLASGADLLVSESAFSSDLEEKAEKYRHMTAKQAAQIASRSQVKRLIITHLSQRYKTPEEVRADAEGIFENVDVAFDFMQVKL
jgi:ribonuclease Z